MADGIKTVTVILVRKNRTTRLAKHARKKPLAKSNMVEKVDKPQPASAYHINATAETDKDRSGGQAYSQSDEYSGSHAAPGWQKIYASASNRRYIKIQREKIAHAWLRNTLMQRGILLAEVDLQLNDGHILKGAHIIIISREDFWTLKRFQMGQEIPLNIILKEAVVEVSVPNIMPRPNVEQPQTVLPNVRKIDIGKIIKYAIAAVILLLLTIFFLTR